MRPLLILLSTASLLCFSFTCERAETNDSSVCSRPLKFDYIGINEDVRAILDGKVFLLQDGRHIPAGDVFFKVAPNPYNEIFDLWSEQHPGEASSHQRDSAVFTSDSTGFFRLYFYKGKYTIYITKTGFQSVVLKYFTAGSGDIYSAEILLVRDTGMTAWNVSKGW